MLDHLRLSIPVLPIFVKKMGHVQTFMGDIREYGLPAATRHVGLDLEGNTITGDLYHPYESLPSSYTDMAVKFYTQSMNCPPYLEIKASPLKLLQGHNLFGFDDIKLAAVEMLGLLQNAYPNVYQILDIANIEVLHLDTTFYTTLPHQSLVQPVLNYLANCSAGHRKAKKVAYDNYITWGSETARYLRPKAYGKFEEMKAQLKKLQAQADKGCSRSKLLVMKTLEVLPLANAVIRFEGRVCKTYLQKNGYPTNLWALIKEQRTREKSGEPLLTHLWHKVFDPILDTLKGKTMNYSNDGEVLEKFREELYTFTKSGKKSYTKANNMYKFYNLIRQMGLKKIKEDKLYSDTAYYRNLNTLFSLGYGKGEIQNLHVNPNGKVVPVVSLVHINFSKQVPDNYVIPTSRYYDDLYAA